MRSDSYLAASSPRKNGGVHRIGIAGVKTGRDICRADQVEKPCVVSRAFAEVGVQIDRQFHALWRLKPMRNAPSHARVPLTADGHLVAKLRKNDAITGTKLRCNAKIDGDHRGAIFWVPPDRLQSPKQNRFAAW